MGSVSGLKQTVHLAFSLCSCRGCYFFIRHTEEQLQVRCLKSEVTSSNSKEYFLDNNWNIKRRCS